MPGSSLHTTSATKQSRQTTPTRVDTSALSALHTGSPNRVVSSTARPGPAAAVRRPAHLCRLEQGRQQLALEAAVGGTHGPAEGLRKGRVSSSKEGFTAQLAPAAPSRTAPTPWRVPGERVHNWEGNPRPGNGEAILSRVMLTRCHKSRPALSPVSACACQFELQRLGSARARNRLGETPTPKSQLATQSAPLGGIWHPASTSAHVASHFATRGTQGIKTRRFKG